jgi:hypothetical protein
MHFRSMVPLAIARPFRGVPGLDRLRPVANAWFTTLDGALPGADQRVRSNALVQASRAGMTSGDRPAERTTGVASSGHTACHGSTSGEQEQGAKDGEEGDHLPPFGQARPARVDDLITSIGYAEAVSAAHQRRAPRGVPEQPPQRRARPGRAVIRLPGQHAQVRRDGRGGDCTAVCRLKCSVVTKVTGPAGWRSTAGGRRSPAAGRPPQRREWGSRSPSPGSPSGRAGRSPGYCSLPRPMAAASVPGLGRRRAGPARGRPRGARRP